MRVNAENFHIDHVALKLVLAKNRFEPVNLYTIGVIPPPLIRDYVYLSRPLMLCRELLAPQKRDFSSLESSGAPPVAKKIIL